MIYDLVIIGGGISGISTYFYYLAKNPNKKVLIIEQNDCLLRKFSQTGNGKLNFTNNSLSKECFNNGEYYNDIIKKDALKEVLSFYEAFGVKYYSDNEGRYYPISESAKNVRDLIIKKINSNDYTLNTVVLNIEKNDNYFITCLKESENITYESKAVCISSGSINYKSLGNAEGMIKIIEKLGHSFTNIYPSNVYIKTKDINYLKFISGVRTRATVSLYNNDEFIYKETGEILFKDKGISGIVTFNVSNRLANLYKNDLVNNPYLLIDFIPYLKEDELNKEDDLLSYVDKKLIPLFNGDIRLLKNYKLNIESLGEFEVAQSVSGGIKKEELNNNLESKLFKNMYFTGDLIDCDAPCGGYSLSFAVLSGKKVGESCE